MPFGLKNVGATYQRLVNGMFKDLIGKSMETHGRHASQVQNSKRPHKTSESYVQYSTKYQMKLNPLKCAFGVGSGKFLGFMVNQHGIKANLEKINTLLEINSPRKPKEFTSLLGRVAALSRFVSRVIDCCAPFFDVLKGSKKFEWTEKFK